ncbi:MAG: hypothetical protein Kow00105_12880 [Phycisphaeraceae bacterium]
MSETVLVLPLIFFVLALLFFFGQAMTRWQRLSVTDRYEAWRQTRYAPAPGVEFAKRFPEFGSGDQLNQTFFASNADTLVITDRSGRINVNEPIDLISDETYQSAGSLDDPAYDPASAEAMVRELHRYAPAWWRIDVSAEHESDIPLYQRFAGEVRHQSTRIDGDWSFATWIEQQHRGDPDEVDRILSEEVMFVGDSDDYDQLRDFHELRPYALIGIYYTYYEDLDAPLETLAESQDNPLARGIRGIYMNLPTYVGPTVLPEVPYRLVRLHTAAPPDPGQNP